MKTTFFLMAIACMIACGCSKGEKIKPEDDLLFYKVIVKYDRNDIDPPKGSVSLFYLSGSNISEIKPYFIDNSPYIDDVDKKLVFPVKTVNMSYSSSKDIEQSGKKSTATFFWHNLSTLYGKPKAGDYLIVIKLGSEPYNYTWKKVSISKNGEIEKVFRSDAKIGSFFQEW